MARVPGVKTGLPLAVVAAALLASFCYVNTLRNQFVFDDIDIIVRNPLVSGPGLDFAGIFTSHYWRHLTPTGALYRPLTVASYALNHRIGGLDPAGFHLVNLLLHALCSALVVGLASRLGLGRGGALAAGLLFAAHPVHTEAVAGVVGRAELMAAACVMGAWLAHLSSPRGGVVRVAAIAALFCAGLLSKENAVVLPALLIAGDIWRSRRGEAEWRRAAPAWIVCAVIALVWLAARAALLSPVAPGSPYAGPFDGVPAGVRILTALSVMGRYLCLLARPIDLSADYSYDQIPLVTSPAGAETLVSATVLVALAALGSWRLGSSRPPRLDGLCAIVFLIAIAPVSNLVIPIGTMMAERLLYLPSMAFCIALPALWEDARRVAPKVFSGTPAAVSVVLALAGTSAALTIERNRDWKDQLTLFSVTAITSPRSAKAHYNLGVALEDAGRLEPALEQYRIAVSIRPADARAHHNAGLLLAKLGRDPEASFHLEQASRLDPTLPKVFSSLGAVYSRIGRDADAGEAFRKALEQDPDDHVALYNLGTLSLLAGRAAEAVAPLQRARELAPSDPDGRYQLGLAYLEAGRPRDAATEMRAALSLSPELPEAHLQLARALLRLGETDEARREAGRAVALGLALPRELAGALGTSLTSP